MMNHFLWISDFLVILRLTDRKSERNENFLSEETSFGNFLLAPYTPPLRIFKERAAALLFFKNN